MPCHLPTFVQGLQKASLGLRGQPPVSAQSPTSLNAMYVRQMTGLETFLQIATHCVLTKTPHEIILINYEHSTNVAKKVIIFTDISCLSDIYLFEKILNPFLSVHSKN